jgi:hypothetical protein
MLSREFSGTFNGKNVVVPASGTASIDLPLARPLSDNRINAVNMSAVFKASETQKFDYDLSFEAITAKRISDDNSFENIDWNSLPEVKFTRATLKKETTGTFNIGWNRHGIFIQTQVKDKKFCHVERKDTVMRWRNDCLQIYFDTMANGRFRQFKGYDEDDYDYDEEFDIKDSEYDEKYAIVQGEFYDEDENATEELDAIDGNVGDSDEEELYVEEAVPEFEQVSLFEEAVEEAVEEIAEENAEEVAEETTEEVAEETVEEVIEEAVEEVTEEAIEEGTEETVEEPVEEIVEEIAEETAEEIVEEPVEETFEEPVVEEEEEIEAEILYDEDGNEICTYDGVVMHYDSDADDEELFGFDVGDDYYDNEPEKDDEDVSHIIDAYVNVLEKLDNGEDVDFNSIVF